MILLKFIDYIQTYKRLKRLKVKHLCAETPPQSQHPAKLSGHNSCESGDKNIQTDN